MMHNLFIKALPGNTFWLSTGKEITNIKSLLYELKANGAAFFNMHVNDQKNDFANWIRDILKDNELSQNLFITKTLDETIEVISNRIEELQPPADLDRISDLFINSQMSTQNYFRLLGKNNIVLNIPRESLHFFESNPDYEAISEFIAVNKLTSKKPSNLYHKDLDFTTGKIEQQFVKPAKEPEFNLPDLENCIVFNSIISPTNILQQSPQEEKPRASLVVEDSETSQYLQQMNSIHDNLKGFLESQESKNPMAEQQEDQDNTQKANLLEKVLDKKYYSNLWSSIILKYNKYQSSRRKIKFNFNKKKT